MGSPLPQSFLDSIRNLDFYPENLIQRTTYIDALKTYKARLDGIEKELFVTRPYDVNVPFRDLINSGPDFDKRKIYDDEDLQDYLGDASRPNFNGGSLRKDPKCRFIFLYADHSIAPLRITRKMLVRIMSYYQVMPKYLDFLLVFGVHKNSREERFSGFHGQIPSANTQNLQIGSLGRSGLQFQLCYNLKAVGIWTGEDKSALDDRSWSFKQGAIYHHFDVLNGNSLWIVTRADLDIKRRIEELTGKNGNNEDRKFDTPQKCLKSSLGVHLLLCHWSSGNWRSFFQWLEDSTESETYLVVYGARRQDELRQTYSSLHLQKAHSLEERANEAIMVLEGNVEVLSSLRNFYNDMSENDQTLGQACKLDISLFIKQVDSYIHDLKLQITRGQLQVKIIASRKTIILQHLQSQATEKMENLTTSMQKDALTVLVIAFLTFIYLPATFVSTFFSTDIVKYQNQNSSDGSNAMGSNLQATSFSPIALSRWLQVTLPLTVLTFFAAMLWLRRENHRLKAKNAALPAAV